jgi:anti-anti-sigma factor
MSGLDASAAAFELARPQPFNVEVRRREDVAIVRPAGELDLATAATLQDALDSIKRARRLVLDLRGLSFLDSTGLRMLVVLHQRSLREGFQLTLVAPPAPADRALQLSGLHRALPFVTADADADAVR